MFKLVEKIGRAGSKIEREKRQKKWDIKYGKGKWEVVYFFNNRIYTRQEALREFYNKSYYLYLKEHPETVEKLCKTAKEIYNPHAKATGGVDLQCPAVLEALRKLGVSLCGNAKIAVGTYGTKRGQKYPSISYELSPFNIPLWCMPEISVERFWQDYKFLAIKI